MEGVAKGACLLENEKREDATIKVDPMTIRDLLLIQLMVAMALTGLRVAGAFPHIQKLANDPSNSLYTLNEAIKRLLPDDH